MDPKPHDAPQAQPSQEPARRALDAAGLGSWEVDLVTRTWTHRSLRHDQLFGYREQPVQWSLDTAGQHVFVEDRPALRHVFVQALETGDVKLELRVRWPDGSVHWIALRGRTHDDASGRPVLLAGVVQDVTGDRAGEEEQRRGEERVRQVLALKTVGVLFFRLDGRMLDANATFECMTGYAVEELRSAAHWRSLTPPEFWDATAQAASELAQRGETAPYEKQFIRKDGSRFWGLFSPVRLSGSGVDAECMEFIIDITATKTAEAALRRSEQQLALAFQTLPMGIGLMDAAGNLTMLNDGMRRFLPTGIIPSRDPERMGRWRSWDAAGQPVEPKDFPGARALRGETVTPGMQLLYLDDDGQEIWTEVRSAPLRDGEGGIAGALLVAIDVDRLKRSEEAARQA